LVVRGGRGKARGFRGMASLRSELIGITSKSSTSLETPNAGQVEEYGKKHEHAEPPGWG